MHQCLVVQYASIVFTPFTFRRVAGYVMQGKEAKAKFKLNTHYFEVVDQKQLIPCIHMYTNHDQFQLIA